MKTWLYMAGLELRILPPASYLLLLLALVLLALTHGTLELASRWPSHFIENMESFFPLALALISTPILLADSEQGMTELNATLPHRRFLVTRVYAVWGSAWLVIIAGAQLMNIFWGPVPFWSGMLAALGPALFLASLSVWATLWTARVSVGYLVALSLPVADLILKVLGAFSAIPALQLLDTFSYRWATPAMPWWLPKIVMLAVGTILFERAVAKSRHYWSRAL